MDQMERSLSGADKVRGQAGPRLHELVRLQAERTPGAPAVVMDVPGEDGRRVLTYGELLRRVRGVAGRLRARGVGPDAVVAVAGEPTPELVAALLGVLEAGGAYLPLDPRDPPARLRFVVDDAEPVVVLADPTAGERLPDPGVPVLSLGGGEVGGRDGPLPDAKGREEDRSSSHGGPSDRTLAYVLYTSGSTGRPKGVLVEHRSIVNRILWAQDALALGADDVVLRKTPLVFDVSVTEIFWPLVAGARLLLPRPGAHRDPRHLAELVEREAVSVLHFVPSTLPAFLELDGIGERCRSVRHVLAGGEALSFAATRLFHRRMPPGARLHNLYGPTETTVAVTHWEVPRDPADRVVPIGRPIRGARVYLLDEGGRPVSEGEPGEICVGGVPVARGYLKRPDLTAERFVPDPFSEEEGARMYRTGDRGRLRPDGGLEFLGRADRQVQVRGVRVEPAEVEAALGRIDGVREAAVDARPDPAGELRLVAYVVPERPGTVDSSRLRDALARELPEAMLPGAFVDLPELPRGTTEKVDPARLPDPAGVRPELKETYVPGRDGLERFVQELWTEILGLDRVGIHDRFFELGGSSLQAARFVNRVAEALGEPVYVVTLFDAPTVSGYAAFLRREYPDAVARRFGGAGAAPGEGDPSPARTGRESVPSLARSGSEPGNGRSSLDAEAVARFQAAVPRHLSTDVPAPAPDDRNPPALFILAPPRSGTTLLRVMLAGHPGIFAAPELQLLGFETLGQRREALSGRQAHWLEGTVRTLMEVLGTGPDEARAAMTRHEEEGLDTRTFYRRLQERVAPRLVADKTPAYALDPEAFRRAERDFREPLYIHLVRHPWATIRSFREQRLEQLLHLGEHDFTPREVAELVWLVSHRNVREFLETVPARRWIRIRFEELVRWPDGYMRSVCRKLRLPYEPAMADPYRDLDGKMVDGVHPESTPMGDETLRRRSRIDPSVARRHLEGLTRECVSPLTWRLARSLGYPVPPMSVPEGAAAGPRDGNGSEGTDRGRFRRGRIAALRGRGGAR